MRLSLCLIVGNESACIERCLAAFAPAVDEVSMVRAVGALEADDTQRKARAFCAERGMPFLFSEYRNGEGAQNWPHVDDFAAARNQSFQQATGDWLVWADADDIVAPGCDILELRTLAENAEIDVWHLPYRVPGTNKSPYRERLIRRSLFEAGRKWRFEIHENIGLRAGDRSRIAEHPAWLHAPSIQKPAGGQRNLRVLDRALEDMPAKLFYVHQEHQIAGAFGKAKHFGELALKFPSLDQSFRYEILLNLARVTKNRADAFELAARAYGVMPHCREALAAMALISFEVGDLIRATSLTEQMLRIPEPAPELRPWTHEARWYGWAGYDVRARALRLAGRLDEAAGAQVDAHRCADAWPEMASRSEPLISLLHATRGRPQQAVHARDAWLASAANPGAIQHIFAVDPDDKETVEMARQFEHVVTSEPGSCVRAWNAAAAVSKGKLLIQLSDDWVPVAGWDLALMEAIRNSGRNIDRDELVIAISDGTRTDDLLCMAVLNRVRYQQQYDVAWQDGELTMTTAVLAGTVRTAGPYLFAPDYESVYSDNEFSHRAWRDGVVIDARASITFQHLHPAFGKAPNDATYAASNAPERYARGLEAFKRRNPDAKI